MQSIQISFLGLNIEVSSEEISTLQWLQEFFYGSSKPHLERNPSVSTLRIAHMNDSRKLADLRRMCESSDETIAAFVLDSEVQRMPCFIGSEPSVCAYSAFQNIAYVVSELIQVVKEDLSKTEEYRGRGGLMRAIREFAMDHIWRQGYSILHGSAFVIDGMATAFVGDKCSGKTTALCGALTFLPNSEFLANDRIIVGSTDDNVVAYGLPTIISIRNGGAMLLKSLNAKLGDLKVQYDGSPFSGNDPSERRLLTTRGFSSLMNCGIQSSATLRSIVFPIIDHHQKDFLLRKLSMIEVHQRLPIAAFARGHLHAQSELFSLPKSGPIASAFEKRERLMLIGQKTNCYELRMSPGFYTPNAMREFMKQVSD